MNPGVTLFRRNSSNRIDFISCFGQTAGICTNRPFGTYDNVKRTRASGVESFHPHDAQRTGLNGSRAITSTSTAEDRTSGTYPIAPPQAQPQRFVFDWGSARLAPSSARACAAVGRQRGCRFPELCADVESMAIPRRGLRAAVPLGERLEASMAASKTCSMRPYETVSGYGTYGRNAHVGVRAKF